MTKKSFINFIFSFTVLFLFACSTAMANPIVVTKVGADIRVRQAGEFELLIDQSRGGVISHYFDLQIDPNKNRNIAVNKSQGSLYHGLYFTMFKQGGGNLPVPEKWTAQWETGANMEILYQKADKVIVHVTGDFHGHLHLPASYDIVYTIESDPNTSGALIYMRSRIIFNSNYSNTMQIRQAFALNGSYNWYEYSQNGPLPPYWTYRPGDDYVGAALNASGLKTDPLIILYRDWSIATYILSIGPPKINNYSLFGWVSNKYHSYSAGHTIENKYLIRMDQKNIDSISSGAALAAAYRASDGGDFEGKADVNVGIFLPLLLTDPEPAQLTIVKKVINDNGGEATVDDFSLRTDADGAADLTFDAGSVSGDTTTYTSNTITKLSAGTYSLVEDDFEGYTEGTWSCVGAAGAVNNASGSGSVEIAEGESVTCTITNDDDSAQLTIVKKVINDNSGTKRVNDFSLTTDAGTLTFDDETPNSTVGSTTTYTSNAITGLSAGTYTLVESDVGGYTEETWSCVGAAGAVVGTFNNGSVEIANGENVTCTITNDDD